MNNIYELLEFNTPKFLVNPHGIKLYIGEKDKDDWCVVIPNKLVNGEKDFTYYGLTEKEALETCSMWTRRAKESD